MRRLSESQIRAQHNWVALTKELIRRYGTEPVLKRIFLEWSGWIDQDDKDEMRAYLVIESAIGEEAIYADE